MFIGTLYTEVFNGKKMEEEESEQRYTQCSLGLIVFEMPVEYPHGDVPLCL